MCGWGVGLQGNVPNRTSIYQILRKHRLILYPGKCTILCLKLCILMSSNTDLDLLVFVLLIIFSIDYFTLSAQRGGAHTKPGYGPVLYC